MSKASEKKQDTESGILASIKNPNVKTITELALTKDSLRLQKHLEDGYSINEYEFGLEAGAVAILAKYELVDEVNFLLQHGAQESDSIFGYAWAGKKEHLPDMTKVPAEKYLEFHRAIIKGYAFTANIEALKIIRHSETYPEIQYLYNETITRWSSIGGHYGSLSGISKEDNQAYVLACGFMDSIYSSINPTDDSELPNMVYQGYLSGRFIISNRTYKLNIPIIKACFEAGYVKVIRQHFNLEYAVSYLKVGPVDFKKHDFLIYQQIAKVLNLTDAQKADPNVLESIKFISTSILRRGNYNHVKMLSYIEDAQIRQIFHATYVKQRLDPNHEALAIANEIRTLKAKANSENKFLPFSDAYDVVKKKLIANSTINSAQSEETTSSVTRSYASSTAASQIDDGKTEVYHAVEFPSFIRGKGLYGLGKYDQALPFFRIVLKESLNKQAENDSILTDIYYYLGKTYLKLNQTDIALTYLKRLPESSDVLDSMGLAYYQQKKFDEAQTYYLKALVMDKNHVSALHNLGLLYFTNDTFDQAETYLNKAHELEPENPYILHSLGNLYDRLEDNKKTIECFELALKYCPDNDTSLKQNIKQDFSEALSQIGHSFYKKGDIDQATKYYKQSIDAYAHQNLSATYQLGMCELKKDNINNARNYFNQSIKVSSTQDADSWVSRAVCLKKDNKLMLAKGSLKIALELAPNDETAQIEYKEVLAKRTINKLKDFVSKVKEQRELAFQEEQKR